MDMKKVKQILLNLSNRSSDELSKILQEADHSQWTEEAFEAIKEILGSRKQTQARVSSLEQQGNVESLLSILTCSDKSVSSIEDRIFAASALGRMKCAEAVDHLILIAEDHSLPYKVKSAAIRALGQIGSTKAGSHLALLSIDDSSEGVREEAADALEKFDDLSKHGEYMVFENAAYSYGLSNLRIGDLFFMEEGMYYIPYIDRAVTPSGLNALMLGVIGGVLSESQRRGETEQAIQAAAQMRALDWGIRADERMGKHKNSQYAARKDISSFRFKRNTLEVLLSNGSCWKFAIPNIEMHKESFLAYIV